MNTKFVSKTGFGFMAFVLLATVIFASIPTQSVYAGTKGQHVQVQTIYNRDVQITGKIWDNSTRTWSGKSGTFGGGATGFARTEGWWFLETITIKVRNGDGSTWTTCTKWVAPNQRGDWAYVECRPRS